MKKKIAISIVAVALVLCCAIGGTLAWLTDKTDPVTNTFTVGNINIELKETTSDYKMVPGNTIAKDPKVTVKANSEACYLFVKVTKSGNFDQFLTYAKADGWTQYEGATDVWYRTVPASNANQKFERHGHKRNDDQQRFHEPDTDVQSGCGADGEPDAGAGLCGSDDAARLITAKIPQGLYII